MDPKLEIIARSLRTVGAVCFIGIVLTSGVTTIGALPTPIRISLGISLAIAISAQVWLWKLLRLRKRH